MKYYLKYLYFKSIKIYYQLFMDISLWPTHYLSEKSDVKLQK